MGGGDLKPPLRVGGRMLSLAERAERFRALHRAPRLFVLPNAWDVPSARVFEDAGFPAVATSSAGVMVSLGYPDGEEIPREVYVAAVRRIAAKLAVPLSADVVAGFGRTATEVADTVRAVVEAGRSGSTSRTRTRRRRRCSRCPPRPRRSGPCGPSGRSWGSLS